MITCILLTAGESIRFGSPKALAKIYGQHALVLLQQKLIESLISKIIIVTGAHDELIKPYVLNHSRVSIVYNKDYKFGQTSSFQAGLNSVEPDSSGYMLLPVDCPFISTDTINNMTKEFLSREPDILIPCYQSKRGHPPVFHRRLKDKILALRHSQGLNSLSDINNKEELLLDDPGIIQTFNTQDELARLTA